MTYPVHHYFVAAKHQEFALGGGAAELCRVGRMYHGSASLPPLDKEFLAAFLYTGFSLRMGLEEAGDLDEH